MRHLLSNAASIPQGIGPLFDSVNTKSVEISNKLVVGDICANKHGGNPESVQAFEKIKVKLSARQNDVLWRIKTFNNGLTVDELSELMFTTPNAISGRVSELKRMGKIYKDGTRKTRSGCQAAILKAT